MTSVPPLADKSFACSARYGPGSEPVPSTAGAELTRRFAERRGRAWGAEICSYLDVWPTGPVTITLRPGIRWSMTKGSEIFIGVSPGVVSTALSHELVHAIAGPSPTQAYSEGLAVHVDARLRLAGPAWPFFHLAPHRWTRSFLDDGTFLSLAQLLGSPRILPTTEVGLSEAARFYLEAGSFVGFAIRLLGGTEAFWPSFRSGEAIPGWGLDSLEARWVASLGPAITDEERRRRDASIPLLADEGGHGQAPPAVGSSTTGRLDR